MSASRITVGISTLDRPEQLRRCLAGLLAGARRPDQLVVVDQGTSAQTARVVAELESQVPTDYIRQQRCGLAASRNVVALTARWPIVAVTDDDCVPDHDWLANVAQAFVRAPEPDGVSGRVLALGPELPGTYAVSLRTSEERRDHVGDELPWVVGTGANFAARREWLLRVGGYDERLGTGSPGRAGEDLDLNLRLLRAGARLRYEPSAVVYHERQDRARRIATRWTYGHGIGAICGMLCRQRDRFGVLMLARSLRHIAGRALRALPKRDWSALYQAGLSLAGTAAGVTYGWRVGRGEPVSALTEPDSLDACRLVP